MLAQWWNHSLNGVVFGGNEVCGALCFMWVAARTTNSQKKSQRLVSMSIAQAMLQIVWFAHSATPFWEGESGMVFSYMMLCALQWAFICPWTSFGALLT